MLSCLPVRYNVLKVHCTMQVSMHVFTAAPCDILSREIGHVAEKIISSVPANVATAIMCLCVSGDGVQSNVTKGEEPIT